MSAVKDIYQSAQKDEYPPEDCQRIITQIEMNFFDTAFRKAAQTSETLVLSFSLLWGHPMSVRVLNETSHDSWFKVPSAGDRMVSRLHGPSVKDEDYHATLKFSIEELNMKSKKCRKYKLNIGDAVFFRGELCEHWITPVSSGKRCILQIELCKYKNHH